MLSFLRTYYSLQDLCQEELRKWTGAENISIGRKKDSSIFYFEDEDDSSNLYMNRLIGVVDSYSEVSIDSLEGDAVFLLWTIC